MDNISVLVSETKFPNGMYYQVRYGLCRIALYERHCTLLCGEGRHWVIYIDIISS